MKNYIITVNGVSYDVSVEEVGASAPSSVASAPVATPVAAPRPAAKPAAKPAASVAAGQTPVKSPMPGAIVRIAVKVGDTVKKDSVLLVLEAMKMENDIVAPKDGKVASINVSERDSVNTGDVLITLA